MHHARKIDMLGARASFNFRTAKDQHGRSVQNSSQRPGSFEYSHQSKVGTRDFKITKFSLKMN